MFYYREMEINNQIHPEQLKKETMFRWIGLTSEGVNYKIQTRLRRSKHFISLFPDEVKREAPSPNSFDTVVSLY